MVKAITEAQIRSAEVGTRTSLKVDAILQKLSLPMTYTYKEREFTIKNAWKDGDAIWLDVSITGIDLENRNPFYFKNPRLKVGTGEFETVITEDGFAYRREIMVFDPLTAMKECLWQATEGVK